MPILKQLKFVLIVSIPVRILVARVFQVSHELSSIEAQEKLRL